MTVTNWSSFLVVASLLLTHVDFGESVRKSCGSNLTKRLSSICEHLGGYNIFSDVDRVIRSRRSIVEECCRSACSDRSISQYCQNASSKELESDDEVEIPPNVPYMLHLEHISLHSSIERSTELNVDLESTTEYQPIRFGTVSPEYTKNAMWPHIPRLVYHHRKNAHRDN